MNEDGARPARDIHLLTTDAVLADLVSGREVIVRDNDRYSLDSDGARSVLDWYRENGGRWAANQNAADIEAIIDAVDGVPPAIATDANPAPTVAGRRLTLKRMVAHRFAGLHVYGRLTDAPDTFVFTPTASVTLFEGANGSGKTSILNAMIWCLTGNLIRSQREPESGMTEFACEITHPDDTVTLHQMSSVTPMPNFGSELPEDGKPIPADTWVELTFVDADGNELPPVRRHQTRNQRGKLQEAEPDLDALGLDPIAWRIATTMPAMLPFLSVGSASQLGQAVARLTGLANLVDLAKHAGNAATRISTRRIKEIEAEIAQVASRYGESVSDLKTILSENSDIAFEGEVPVIDAADTEQRLVDIATHFSDAKAAGLATARTVLGEGFDPQVKADRDDLERNIRPAIEQLARVKDLPSISRLTSLPADEQQLADMREWFAQIDREAATLAELADNPDRAKRAQLYAMVSSWIHRHEHPADGRCPVCTGDLVGARDPVTGEPVADQIAGAQVNRELVAQTVRQWAAKWHGQLLEHLPEAIAAEARKELPSRPVDLVITGMTTELYATDGFRGTLGALAQDSDLLVEETAASLPPFDEPAERTLPPGIAEPADALLDLMKRVDRAIAFANWRKAHAAALSAFIQTVRRGDEDSPDADRAIGRRLKTLLSIIESVAPLNQAGIFVSRLEAARAERSGKVDRIAQCGRAVTALEMLVPLGTLAQAQVDSLRSTLQTRSDHWRSAMYQNATTYAPDLTGTVMDAKGVLGLQVGRDGVNAPAQHISNASALRGALLGFFLAFREYVLRQRGGLTTLVLDDPQELLDNDNRERLARGLSGLASSAQLLITTHDRKFARCLVAEHREGSEHLSVHPVNSVHPTVFVAPAQEEVDRKRGVFLDSPDNHAAAQDYASDLRVFLEARLGDLFDSIAHPAYTTTTKAVTLMPLVDRLRGMVGGGSGELFQHPLVKQFANDPAFAEGADARRVLNQSHHDKTSITYMDVDRLKQTFAQLRTNVEKVHEQFRLHRWREPLETSTGGTNVVALRPLAPPVIAVPICPDIAAFMGSAPSGGSQDVSEDSLDGTWFQGKSLYYVRGESLGFAIPPGSAAIVECEPYPGRDHNLVIARHKKHTFARRIARSPNAIGVSLSAQMPDPRDSRATMTYDDSAVRLYRIVGAVFTDMPPPAGGGEATPIETVPELDTVQIAYRVKEDSAIPLALPGQVILGGAELTPAQLDGWTGKLAAVTLADGTSIFKRVGSRLPGALGHLRQFETIGGLGSSMVVATEAVSDVGDVPLMTSARRVVGVLYDAV
ncbi:MULTISPECIES: ATP-binding protein [Sphingobium]|uniref:ATP-binding protein n=1 Tax=Sphingobium TaxID=165695 RepID=UPI00159C5BE6|nr:ATP-binding protein [Sphingobium sp. 15-1]